MLNIAYRLIQNSSKKLKLSRDHQECCCLINHTGLLTSLPRYASPALTVTCRQIKELNACWNGVFRKKFGYSHFESVKEVIHGLGRLNVKHLFMLYLSENFLHNLLGVCLVHNVDECMKSVFLPLHVAIETVKLSFRSYVYD